MGATTVAKPATCEAFPARSFWRALAVICLLTAFLGVQIASASHLHDDRSEHRHFCPVCNAGHIPALRANADIRLAPPSIITWRVSREELAIVHCHLPLSQSPRAPPV